MWTDPFLVRAGLAALGVAIAAAPLGCFVLWRRMAYFGDATAHAAILGVALSLAAGLPILLGVLFAATVMALAMLALSRRGLGEDAALGVLAHGALAIGIVAVAMLPGRRVDLESYLLGDILSVAALDLALIWAGAAVVIVMLAANWRGLLLLCVDRDLAAAERLSPARLETLFVLLLALIVAAAIKIVGVVLIAGLLIIPAATARPLASTPEGMALKAGLAAVSAALSGVWASWTFDAPTGPTIVVAASVLFAASTVWAATRPR